jgi:hypothetical protein
MQGSTTDNQGGVQSTSPRLLSCAADRTLYVRRRAEGGLEVVKVFETGSMDDARAEVAISKLAAVDGVVRYREAGLDPITGRPCVVLDHHAGRDLQRWLDESGTLSPRSAARVVAAVARTLDRLHSLRVAPAPDGIVHADVKPANVMLLGSPPDPITCDVLLIDLEHAGAVGNGAEHQVHAGTPGFAPPEAGAGSLTPAFDVWSLGALLHALALGHPPHARRSVQHETAILPRGLASLIDDCLQHDPSRRPTAGEVAGRLETFLATQSEACRQLDHVLAALASADLDEADSMLRDVALPEPDRLAALRRELLRRRRLRDRRPVDWALPDEKEPVALAQALAQNSTLLAAWLRRFPSETTALHARTRCLETAAQLVQLVPPLAAEHRRAARFDSAASLLQSTLEAVSTVESLLGRTPLRPPTGHWLPTALQREPVRLLQQAVHDLRLAAQAHERLHERLLTAESRLDPAGAARAVEAATEIYGGASEVIAAWKDRAHRLRFYLERAARAAGRVPALRDQLDAEGLQADLGPLFELIAACAERAEVDLAAVRKSGGSLRALQRTLQDLTRELPHTAPAVDPALRALAQALDAATDRAWSLLEECGHKLAGTPIPIRPLQTLINRVDALRLLEAFVDRPDHGREELLEALERVRMQLEQARTTRDRLARGAQEALARGHVTTAMFDITRVVDRFGADSDTAGGTTRQLASQLEEARRIRQALSDATTRNQSLAARYSQLQDDTQSTFDDRLGVLGQRREVLEFLLRHLQADRAEPYLRDLRDVEVQIVHEHAERGERAIDGCADPVERLGIARGVLERLRDFSTARSNSTEPLGRVHRVLQRWQQHLERAELEVRHRDDEQRRAREQRQRGRLWRAVKVAGVLALLLGVWRVAEARTRGETLHDVQRAVAGRFQTQASGDALARELLAFGLQLDHPALHEAARRVRTFAQLLQQAAGPEALRAELLAFETALGEIARATGAEFAELHATLRAAAEQMRAAAR